MMMTMMFHDDVFDGEVFHDDYNLDGIGDYDKKSRLERTLREKLTRSSSSGRPHW